MLLHPPTQLQPALQNERNKSCRWKNRRRGAVVRAWAQQLDVKDMTSRKFCLPDVEWEKNWMEIYRQKVGWRSQERKKLTLNTCSIDNHRANIVPATKPAWTDPIIIPNAEARSRSSTESAWDHSHKQADELKNFRSRLCEVPLLVASLLDLRKLRKLVPRNAVDQLSPVQVQNPEGRAQTLWPATNDTI